MLSDAEVMLHSHYSSIPPGSIRRMDVKSTSFTARVMGDMLPLGEVPCLPIVAEDVSISETFDEGGWGT